MGIGRFKWLMLVSACSVALITSSVSAAEAGDNSTQADSDGTIVVYGKRLPDPILDIEPDAEFDENDIAAYGFDTVRQVIDQIGRDLDSSGDGPVILINGELANGVQDVADLPVEAVRRVQVLPQNVSARLGQSPTRRVINVVIKPDLKQLTVNAKGTLAPRGDAFQREAEINFLKLANLNRRSLVVRAQQTNPLFESQRAILPDSTGIPFDRVGNVVPLLLGSEEIDPALSSVAGTLVSVAAIPLGVANPTLTDFAELANNPNLRGAAAFRTLTNATSTISANGNLTQRFSAATSLNLNARIEYGRSTGYRGLSSGLLNLPATSPFSDFSQNVNLAFLLGDPLRSRQRSTLVYLAQALNTRVGKVSVTARTNYTRRTVQTLSDRSYDLAQLNSQVLTGTFNPFAGIDGTLLGPVRRDRSNSSFENAGFEIVAISSPFSLPAGPAQLTASVKGRLDRLSSGTEGTFSSSQSYRRDEIGADSNLQLPILPLDRLALGRLTLDLNAGLRGVSSVEALHDYGAGLNWQFGKVLSLTATISKEDVPPPASALNDAVIVNENFRVFDFIRQESVLVRYVSGGNPALPLQTVRSTTLEATLRPLSTYDVSLNAQYSRRRSRDLYSLLPPVSAEVQAAFPDRYIRDASGSLVQIDARPVSFMRDEVEQVRLGAAFRRTIGGTSIGEEDDAGHNDVVKANGVRINLTLNDVVTLSSIRQARQALPEIDLLRGGALGYGGGSTRHLLTFDAGIASRGLGLQINGAWRGQSFLTSGTLAAASRLTFSNRAVVDARFFANLGPLLRDRSWAKGLRLSVQASNLFDSAQRVRDESGEIPQRYQAFLLDPVGRNISFSIRKAF